MLDRPNFSVPNRQVFAGAVGNEAPLATAGQVTRTVNTARQIQLGVKLIF